VSENVNWRFSENNHNTKFIFHLSLHKEKVAESCVGRKGACDEMFDMAETMQTLLFEIKKVTPRANQI